MSIYILYFKRIKIPSKTVLETILFYIFVLSSSNTRIYLLCIYLFSIETLTKYN